MKNEDLNKKSFWESRAVMTCVIAVTAFLYSLTMMQLISVKVQERDLAIAQAETEAKKEPEQSEKVSDKQTELSGNRVEDSRESDTEIPNTTEITDIPDEQMPETEPVITKPTQRLPYYLKINRLQNVVTVYGQDEKGEYTIPVKAILCSTGRNNATPKGVFRLSSKYIWRQLYGGVYGQYASRIVGGVLFHSVPYASPNKATLYWNKYNQLGQQASMGCVRLTVADAKWIYENCPSGTTVEVYDDSKNPGPLGKPEALKLDKDNGNKNWDPTDPDERNPWHQWSEDE